MACPVCNNKTEKQFVKNVNITVEVGTDGEPVISEADILPARRLTKHKFCILASKLIFDGKLNKKIYTAVIQTLVSQGYYPISYSSAYRAFDNYIRYGYTDGRAKDGHIERRASLSKSRAAYQSALRHGNAVSKLKDRCKVTRAVASRALLLWYNKSKTNGITLKSIYDLTGVCPNTLYKLIKEYAYTGKIFGKTLCDFPGTFEPCITRYLAVEGKYPSYFKISPKNMRQFMKGRSNANYQFLNNMLFNLCDSMKIKSLTVRMIKSTKKNPMNRSHIVK